MKTSMSRFQIHDDLTAPDASVPVLRGALTSGGQLPNLRSSPMWLNTVAAFYIEEAPCGSTCGPGPATQPDGYTFTYDVSLQVEHASKIGQVLGAWPRPGQT